MVAVTPLTVHTGVVDEAKLTGNPEDAVALIVNGATPYVFPLGATKVMVWLLNAVATGMLRWMSVLASRPACPSTWPAENTRASNINRRVAQERAQHPRADRSP